MGRSLWVAKLSVSESVAQKLSAKHSLDWRDIRDAVVCTPGLHYRWHRDPERGRRVLVEIILHGVRCVVVLYPVEDHAGNVFALGSAYPL